MKALYRVPPDDPVVSAFIPLSTDVIACHGIPASNVYAENPPKSSGKPGALHLPDSPAPSVHPRKSAGRGKNPFLFAMLFEKNIEIFSDPNPSVLCVFSICLPPFRAWGQGKGTAGSSVTDTTREATGRFGGRYFETSAPAIPNGVSGVFTKTTGELSLQSPVYQGPQISEPYLSIAFSLSGALSGHTGSEIAPVHIWQPCIVYLGNSA